MSQEETKTETAAVLPQIVVPAVYRERGSLMLTFDLRADTVDFLWPHYREKAGVEYVEKSMSVTLFYNSYTLADQEQFPPTYLALNLLGRASEGFPMSARVKERLIQMLKKEELMKLSERALAKEYSRIMGLDKPLQKIPSDPAVRGKRVDEMLAKLVDPQPASETATAATTTESIQPGAAPTEAGAAAASGQPPAPASEDDVAKKKAKKGAKKREAGRSITIEKCDRKNPYREGSKKHQAFDIYAKGGERAKVVEQIIKLGVTASTANTWLYFFSAVAKTGKQPDWKEKRKA